MQSLISYAVNFAGWIKLIYDKLTLIYNVKMRLFQPLKFRILKMGCFEMPHLETPRLQMGVFQTVITVASGLKGFSILFE